MQWKQNIETGEIAYSENGTDWFVSPDTKTNVETGEIAAKVGADYLITPYKHQPSGPSLGQQVGGTIKEYAPLVAGTVAQTYRDLAVMPATIASGAVDAINRIGGGLGGYTYDSKNQEMTKPIYKTSEQKQVMPSIPMDEGQSATFGNAPAATTNIAKEVGQETHKYYGGETIRKGIKALAEKTGGGGAFVSGDLKTPNILAPSYEAFVKAGGKDPAKLTPSEQADMQKGYEESINLKPVVDFIGGAYGAGQNALVFAGEQLPVIAAFEGVGAVVNGVAGQAQRDLIARLAKSVSDRTIRTGVIRGGKFIAETVVPAGTGGAVLGAAETPQDRLAGAYEGAKGAIAFMSIMRGMGVVGEALNKAENFTPKQKAEVVTNGFAKAKDVAELDGMLNDHIKKGTLSEQNAADIREAVTAKLQAQAGEAAAKVEARTDPMTGLGSKRAYDEAITAADKSQATIKFDLDGLKKMNDSKGKPYTNEQWKLKLEAVKNVLKDYGIENVPDQSLWKIFREGGDEHSIIPNNPELDAKLPEIAEKMRMAFSGTGDPELTISVGHGPNPIMAENAVDVAKYRGKNRVIGPESLQNITPEERAYMAREMAKRAEQARQIPGQSRDAVPAEQPPAAPVETAQSAPETAPSQNATGEFSTPKVASENEIRGAQDAVTMLNEQKSQTPGELPKAPEKPNNSTTLYSGIDPGVDNFIAENVKPTVLTIKKAVNAVVGVVKRIPQLMSELFEPGIDVQNKLGDKAYSGVIKAFHNKIAEGLTFNAQKSQIFDKNFEQIHKFFSKLTGSEQNDLNLIRGQASSPEAQKLQADALARLPAHLKDPRLIQVIKEASDYVWQYAQKNGIDVDYFKDYFYGAYKNEGKVDKFLDYWKSTDAYTKEKKLPTIADAQAYGLELKNPNPIGNIADELRAVSTRVGLKNLAETNVKENAPFQVSVENATPEQKKNWEPINDPVFNGQLFDPQYAKFANSMLSTNKLSANGLLRTLRGAAHIAQACKFFGSVFHLRNMLTTAMADRATGLDPRGTVDFIKAFKPLDRSDPQYIELARLGLTSEYSQEANTDQAIQNMVNKFKRGNYLGSAVNAGIGTIFQKPIIPGSPGMIHWMFKEFIPKLKFERTMMDIATEEQRLGRPLTDGEKIKIGRDTQNRYGMMNEKLFGRSGTVTTALRLFFMAPSYGEGNYRVTFGSLTNWGKNSQSAKRSTAFMVNTLINTVVTASIGTYLFTKKPPKIPKNVDEVRDLFKIDTGQKDGNGDPIMVDLLTYGKDFWAIYGNLAKAGATAIAKKKVPLDELGQIPSDLTTRASGSTSPGYRILTDLSTLAQGGMVYDYKQNPLFYKTDSFGTKLKNLIQREAETLSPISVSSFKQMAEKGVPLGANVGLALAGIRTTSTEQVKMLKASRSDLFALGNKRDKTLIDLNKLYSENPEEAEKERIKFNEDQMRVVNKIAEKVNPDGVDQNAIESKCLIKSLKEKKKYGTETNIDYMFHNKPHKAHLGVR